MQFEALSARYECALVTFQPRTKAVDLKESAALAG